MMTIFRKDDRISVEGIVVMDMFDDGEVKVRLGKFNEVYLPATELTLVRWAHRVGDAVMFEGERWSVVAVHGDRVWIETRTRSTLAHVDDVMRATASPSPALVPDQEAA